MRAGKLSATLGNLTLETTMNNFLRSEPQLTCFAPIDLKQADLYIRDGFDNDTSTPTTGAVEPIGESIIAISNMDTVVPIGATVKFGSDDTEYTVSAKVDGGGTNEQQVIQIDDATSGGTFKLQFSGEDTGTIAYGANAATVQSALEALSTIGVGKVTVSGASPEWTVTFVSTFASTDVDLITGDGTSLTGGDLTDVDVTETTTGVAAVNEVQTLTVTGTPAGGDTVISYGGDSTGDIPYDAEAADVELALEAMDSIPQGEATCGGGPWPGSAITVTFSGSLAGQDVTMLTNVDSFTGGTAPVLTITETTPGVEAVDEVQTVHINSSVTGGTFTLTYAGQTTSPGIAPDATAAQVKAALESLSNIDPGDLTVTGGAGPKKDWIVEFGGTLAATDVAAMTGTGTSLTGGSSTTVSTWESVKGVTATGSSQITVSPGLVLATTVGGSVTFNGRKLEIKIGEGNLTFTENTPHDYILDRGLLDTVRLADQEPMDVSFEFTWEFLSAVSASGTPTIKEALKNTGEASDWESSSDDACEPYCVDIEVNYDPGCGGDNTELIVLQQFRTDSLDHNLRDSQVSATGKCNVTGAVETRGA
jgi:hypothetical protein